MTYATTTTGTSGGTLAAWRRTPVALRLLVVVVAAVLAVELLGSVFGSVLGSRVAPVTPTSPYATGANGTAAFVRLLEEAGDHVTVDTSPLVPSSVPAGGTLLVLDLRRWSTADAVTARTVIADRGDVVFAGRVPASAGGLVAGVSVSWRPSPVGPVAEVAATPLGLGVTGLTTGVGELVVAGTARVDVRGADGDFVASAGAVSWVASSAPLRNANLARLDNAALALNLTRPHGRSVVLDASDLAAGSTSSGLLALPLWWRSGIAVALAALVVWLLSAARRFGPLESPARPLAPPRAGYAEAMAALLDALPQSQVHEATAPVHDAAHRALVRAVGADGSATPAELSELSAGRGVPSWVVDAVTIEVSSRDDAVRAGRALAWLRAERSTR